MANKYKLILLGKIAAGHDKEIVHEKLAIIFEIELKKIPKLLKKPLIIRKNLSHDVVLQYKNGLEYIGVLCDTDPPLKNESTSAIHSSEKNSIGDDKDLTTDDFDAFSITDDIEEPIEESVDDTEELKTWVIQADDKRKVINIKMPLGSMAIFLIKWILASIPAVLILGGVNYLLQQAIVMFLSNFIS